MTKTLNDTSAYSGSAKNNGFRNNGNSNLSATSMGGEE
jgi:hypothetical protein